MGLAHYLFTFWHEAFSPMAQVDNQCSTFISYNCAAYDFPFSLNELGIDTVPFIGPYLLNHYLLGCLSRDSAKLPDVDLFIVFEGLNLPGGPVDVHDYFTVRLTKVLTDR